MHAAVPDQADVPIVRQNAKEEFVSEDDAVSIKSSQGETRLGQVDALQDEAVPSEPINEEPPFLTRQEQHEGAKADGAAARGRGRGRGRGRKARKAVEQDEAGWNADEDNNAEDMPAEFQEPPANARQPKARAKAKSTAKAKAKATPKPKAASKRQGKAKVCKRPAAKPPVKRVPVHNCFQHTALDVYWSRTAVGLKMRSTGQQAWWN